MQSFGSRRPNRSELRALAREVWGEDFYASHRAMCIALRMRARARAAAVGLIVVTAFGAGGCASVLTARTGGRLIVDSTPSTGKPGHGHKSTPTTSGRGSGIPTPVNSTTVASTSPPTTSAPTSTSTSTPPATDPPSTVAPTTVATTTPPTTVDPGSQEPLIWSADMETGDLSEWKLNGGGNMENSGSYSSAASRDVAHSGSWSLKASINTSGGTSGVRAFRWVEPRVHQSGYYSVWLYIPTTYHFSGSQQWWNVFQFKSRTASNSAVDPVWAFYADEDAGGMYLRAGWGWGGTNLAGPYPSDGVSGKWYAPLTKRYLPVGRWIHLEAFLKASKDFNGALTFWQDGAKLFDFSGIRTSYPNCNFNSWCADNEWSVNLYSDGLSPNPSVVYFDDAGISAGYIG